MSDRRALVTGAASGIGAACVERFLGDGLEVTALDIDGGGEALASWRSKLRAVHAVDVSDPTAVRSLPDLNELDVVVQCAGTVGPNMALTDVPFDQWQRTFDINVTGIFNVMQAVIPGMVQRGWGRIVNVASIAGKEGNPNLAAYSAAKAAVIGITKCVGKELATTGVLVNSIAPAVIATEMNATNTAEVLDYMVSKIPMQRTGTADEVAALVVWLVSDECSFSTGACYDISGGRATY